MKRFIVVVACYSVWCAFAGPFGMSKGMTLEELKKQGNFSSSGAFQYEANTIKSGHPDFELYIATLTPEHGLCKIGAASKDIQTSDFGTELENKYNRLVEAMSEKYGAPKNYNFLKEGSIWKERRYWMMSLLKKERTLRAYWTSPEQVNLPDSIKAIEVDTLPLLTTSKGYITITYEFNNANACHDFIKAKRNANL